MPDCQRILLALISILG